MPNTTRVQPPPLGLCPRWVVTEHRIQEIKDAINRYINEDKPVPVEWIEELRELLVWYRAYFCPSIDVEVIYISNLYLE